MIEAPRRAHLMLLSDYVASLQVWALSAAPGSERIKRMAAAALADAEEQSSSGDACQNLQLWIEKISGEASAWEGS